ncbi:MAG: NADH-quinone oxidoreductase subunit NuoE [Alphaproteobacteria bacterium]|nr:NADH-quinone oxidoreductase subunit NuoE [Alphaproteobacteria bacterium]MBM3952821.1 NADH-quinone oxidoreductase subunit NuoE [Rhodospirillales bacterium]
MSARSFTFDADNLKRAEAIVTKYPVGRQASAVMPLLDLAQRQDGGSLTQAAMDYIADYLKMPPIRVYEVASFYTMFNLKPVGKHHVQVCTNLPCWLRGSDVIADTCKRTLGIGFGETTADGQFTLNEVECLGACVNAPMMQINDDYYEDLDPDTTRAVLSVLKQGGKPKTGSQMGRRSCEPKTGLTTLKDIQPKGKKK